MTNFDFKNPQYAPVYQQRVERLTRLRTEPDKLPALKLYYSRNVADFITDWGCTFDPRLIDAGLPSIVPFILFPKQRDFVAWFFDRLNNRENGLVEKSRDMGMSWLTVAIASSYCLLNDGVVVGFGSRKEDYVDKNGDPASLFWKAKQFIQLLPKEFRGEWNERKHCSHLKITFPNGSVIKGESGDNIGRGDRTSFYFVDESAHIPRAELIDASLSATTNCRIDLSSVNGMNNVFADKRFSGKTPVFVFDWRDDPRKDDAWYLRQCEMLPPDVVQQEIDRNYHAYAKGGRVYKYFDRAKHHIDRYLDHGDYYLHIGQDFNVGGCVSTVFVIDTQGNPIAVDEFVSHDTRDLIIKLTSIYQPLPTGKRHISIYPDASGNSNKTSASASDIELLRQSGFTVHSPTRNPLIRDRINAVNGLLAHDRFKINTIKCKHLTHALESQGYDDNGQPEKSNVHPSIDDMNDSAGYFISYKYPVQGAIQTPTFRGI